MMNLIQLKQELIRQHDKGNVSDEDFDRKLCKLDNHINKIVREQIYKVSVIKTKTEDVKQNLKKIKNKPIKERKKTIKNLYKEAIKTYREAVACADALKEIKATMRKLYGK